jgi:hypothetical protein
VLLGVKGTLNQNTALPGADDHTPQNVPPQQNDHVLPYQPTYRDPRLDTPTREQRTTASFAGFLAGFGISIACAAAWWMQNLPTAPPSTPRAPFDWQMPSFCTLVGFGILTGIALVPLRARRDLRIGILTGFGLVLLLQGLCFLK